MEDHPPKGPARAGKQAQPGRPASLLLAGALLPYLFLLLRFDFLIDDAFISFRYARHWAAGEGLRFNLGVEPPVEGFSNFLWVCGLSVMEWLSMPVEVGSRIVSAVCGVATLVCVQRLLVRRLELGNGAVFGATLFLATFPPFVIWSTGGLETAAFTLALFGVYALTLPGTGTAGNEGVRRAVCAGLCGLAVALLRVDGIVWALGVGLLAGAARLAAGEGRGALRRSAVFAGIVIAGYGVLLLGRHAYYESWVSNTVLAKAVLSEVTLVRGLKTLATYFLTVVSGLVVAVLALLALGRPREVHGFVAAGIVIAFLAYNVGVGGDWMPMFRFLAPAAPFMAVVLATRLARLQPTRARLLAAGCVLLSLLPLFDVHVAPLGLRQALYFRRFKTGYESELQRWRTTSSNTVKYTLLGRALAQIRQPGDSYVVGPIGAQGYYSEMFIYDRNGLTNREVAVLEASPRAESAGHDKRVARMFFIEHEPTYLRAAVVPKIPVSQAAPAFRRIILTVARVLFEGEDAELREHCVARIIPLEREEGFPEETSLIVFEFTSDANAARAYWEALGL